MLLLLSLYILKQYIYTKLTITILLSTILVIQENLRYLYVHQLKSVGVKCIKIIFQSLIHLKCQQLQYVLSHQDLIMIVSGKEILLFCTLEFILGQLQVQIKNNYYVLYKINLMMDTYLIEAKSLLLDGRINVPAAGYKFISWEKRHFSFPKDIVQNLIKAYQPAR